MPARSKRCNTSVCQSNVLSRFNSAFIGYGFSALALAAPFLNSAGAKVQNSANISNLSISWTAIIIVGVWIFTGVLTVMERHENAFACVLYACGLPGVLISILAFLKG